jgi:hypothetical protein
MTCNINDNFKIQNGPASGVTANTANLKLCNATKILEHLHKSFTEQYVSGTPATGQTAITDSNAKNTPTFWLRQQPTLGGFNTLNGKTGANPESAGGTTNRLYQILYLGLDQGKQGYRSAFHAIMTGVYDDTVSDSNYLDVPSSVSSLNLSSSPESFKGLYGLIQANNLLEAEIQSKLNDLRGGDSTTTIMTDAKYYKERKNMKTTVEEIAYQENKIYREKFLNIILMVVGIFIVGTQLTQVFSPGGGGGGDGGGGGGLGFGGIGGWLSTRLGSGSGGLFSRFGGLGLGSSGRSRVGNLFTSSPYSLSKRE